MCSNTEQRDALRRIGCRLGQGYLFGEAVPAEEFLMQLSVTSHAWPHS